MAVASRFMCVCGRSTETTTVTKRSASFLTEEEADVPPLSEQEEWLCPRQSFLRARVVLMGIKQKSAQPDGYDAHGGWRERERERDRDREEYIQKECFWCVQWNTCPRMDDRRNRTRRGCKGGGRGRTRISGMMRKTSGSKKGQWRKKDESRRVVKNQTTPCY